MQVIFEPEPLQADVRRLCWYWHSEGQDISEEPGTILATICSSSRTMYKFTNGPFLTDFVCPYFLCLDWSVRGRELRGRRQDLHPLPGLSNARPRQERSPSRFQQRQGGHQGVTAHGVGDEEASAHERCLEFKVDLHAGFLYMCLNLAHILLNWSLVKRDSSTWVRT